MGHRVPAQPPWTPCLSPPSSLGTRRTRTDEGTRSWETWRSTPTTGCPSLRGTTRCWRSGAGGPCGGSGRACWSSWRTTAWSCSAAPAEPGRAPRYPHPDTQTTVRESEPVFPVRYMRGRRTAVKHSNNTSPQELWSAD